MFGRQIVEFLHKRTRQIWSLLTFGELASGGFFHYCESTVNSQLLVVIGSDCIKVNVNPTTCTVPCDHEHDGPYMYLS